MLLGVLLIIQICVITTLASDSHIEEKVESLPGVESMEEDMYSGYVHLEGSYDKQIHYVFVKSRRDWQNDPLIVWFTGGPGCSSMYGAFLEIGPYLVRNNGDVEWNQHAWNHEASVLYIEQPAGVGYSILGPDDENFYNDDISADENL